MECGVVKLSTGADSILKEDNAGKIDTEGRGEGDDDLDFSRPALKDTLFDGPKYHEVDLNEIKVPDEKKRYSLTRGLNFRNVVKGMKRKKTSVEENNKAPIVDHLPGEPKSSRHINITRVFSRVSHGTNRVWTSLGKTFSTGPNRKISEYPDQKAGTSKTLGRLFGRTKIRPEVADLEPPEKRSQTLGRRLTSTFKSLKAQIH